MMTFNLLRKYQQIYLHDCKEDTGIQMDNNSVKSAIVVQISMLVVQSSMLFKLNLIGCNSQREYFPG